LEENKAANDVQPKNLICNFRAPNPRQYHRWKEYVQWAKDNGMDVRRVTLSLVDAFMKGTEGAAEKRNGKQVSIFSKLMFFSTRFLCLAVSPII
jgi:hypothetical protein